MADYDDFNLGQSLEGWVLDKCEDWREHYESNYEAKHEEYFRLWRGSGTTMTRYVKANVLV